MRLVSHDDYRTAARRRLPKVLFDYIDGGSYQEITLQRNEEALREVRLRQRVMRDVSAIDLSTTLLGERLEMPVILGPVGLSGMYARRGEVQAARAAHANGVPFCLSTVGICGVEEVVRDAGAAPWYQLYMVKDRSFIADLLARVWAAGCTTLVFTVDLPMPGARYRDMRSGLMHPRNLKERLEQAWQGVQRPAWLYDVYLRGQPHTLGNVAAAMPNSRGLADFWTWVGANFDPGATWKDIDFIRSNWAGRIVIKGVMEVDDAREAIACGVDGVVVSNHGGRQLDSADASITALERIAGEVGDQTTLLFDGGVRTGLDVLKALALGAKACLLARAWAFPLAAAGEAGVRDRLAAIKAELHTAMVLTGTTSAARVPRDLVARATPKAGS